MKNLNILARFIGIHSNEIFPVLISWIVSFFIRFSIVIAWTILTVFFVVNFGINSIVYLFLIHALGVMLGTLVIGKLVSGLNKDISVILLSVLGGFFVLIAGLIYQYSIPLFLVFAFLSISVIIGQLKIARMLFTESLFTPSQSLRVFPVIESAETIGIIVGGLIVANFAYSFSLSQFMYIWAISLLLIIPAMFWYNSISIDFNLPNLLHNKIKSDDSVGKFSKYNKIKHLFATNKFIVYLIILVAFQWIFATILEFQYTKAIEEAIHTVKDAASYGVASVQFSNDFINDLGRIQAGIGVFALFFQLFLASKVIYYLGTLGSLLIYPIILIFSMFGLIINYGYVTAITTKFNQEVVNILHYNSYHSSYYLIDHDFRSVVAEFIEGFARPFGALIGTLVVIFTINFGNMVVNIMAVLALVGMLFFTNLLRSSYLSLPKNMLLNAKTNVELLNGFDLLIQNKKQDTVPFLIEFLKNNDSLTNLMESKIYKFISDNADAYVVADLLILSKKNTAINLNLLNCINSIFVKHHNVIKTLPFTWNELKSFYNDYLEKEKSKSISVIPYLIIFYFRENKIDDVIRLIGDCNDIDTVKVVISLLKITDDPQLKSYLRVVYDSVKELSLEHLELFEILLSEAEFDFKIINNLLSNNLLILESSLLYCIKYNKVSNYYDYILKINVKNLKDPRILFLVNLCECKYKKFKNLNRLFYNLSLGQIHAISDVVFKIADEKLVVLFNKKIELEVHNMLNRLTTDINDDVDNFDYYTLKSLKKLYFLLGNEKEYYLVEEFLSLHVAT